MITIIMPVFNESGFIYDNVHKVDDLLNENAVSHRFLLVDDGSRDNTWEELERLSDELSIVELIRLSRNFGKEAALCAALEAVHGEPGKDAVVIMDSDLQHPPQYIPEMVRLWQEEGYDVVEGVKKNPGKKSLGGKLAAFLFYRTLRRAMHIDIGQASDFKLMDFEVVEAWRQFRENNTFFRGLSAWTGFRRYAMPFDVEPRAGGDTKWTFRSLSKLAINSIVSFTSAPLMIVFWLGVLMMIMAIIMTVDTLYMYFAHYAQTGFSTVILLQLFIGSGTMLSLSIIGLYVAKIYDEVKRRPRYIVRDHRRASDDSQKTSENSLC